MILVTKNNVSVELLTKIAGGTVGRGQVDKKFLLQTSKGVHTACLRNSYANPIRFLVKHISNSPYAVIRRGSSSTYIGGTLTALVNLIKNEDYEFFIRRQSQ